MITKLTDRILGLLIITELIFLSCIAVSALDSLSDFYEGLPLVLLAARIILHFALGTSAVILFLRSSDAVRWALAAYVGIAILEKLWWINPNTDKYLEMAHKAEAAILQSGAPENISMSISLYPFWWVWVLYSIGLSYVFILRPWCLNTLDQNARISVNIET